MLSYIIDVDTASWETEVIERSKTTPVVVDFWAPWCGPCRMLGPILEKLAGEGRGSFILAKLNVDDNPEISMQYRVQGIPAVKGFVGGQVKAEFVGALPEPKVREWLKELAPSAIDALLEDARSMMGTRHYDRAEGLLRDVLDSQPEHPQATLLLVQSLLAQGKGDAALAYLEDFPRSDEVAQAEPLRPLAELLSEIERNGEPEDDLEALYYNAARLIGQGNFAAGMDGLLDVLRQNKRYRNDQARRVMLSIFALLGEEDPLTNEYRRDLANVLF